MCKHNSWSRLYHLRRAAAARFGDVFDLPIAKRVSQLLIDAFTDEDNVLEVGAGDRRMKQTLQARWPRLHYESIDIDAETTHDYRDLTEISRQYQGIFALEVVEHLTLDEINAWLPQLQRLLLPGGTLVLSTPNTFYPPAYLRDVTHRTPLCYDELAALVESSGLHVEKIVRIYNDPIQRKLLRRYCFGWLFRLIGIDFARQIVLIARRDAASC